MENKIMADRSIISRMESKIDNMLLTSKQTNKSIENINNRINKIEQRFEKEITNIVINEFNKQFDSKFNDRFDKKFDERIYSVEGRISKLENKISHLIKSSKN